MTDQDFLDNDLYSEHDLYVLERDTLLEEQAEVYRKRDELKDSADPVAVQQLYEIDNELHRIELALDALDRKISPYNYDRGDLSGFTDFIDSLEI